MNWAKGRATKGRGTSFKGALTYVLHDKGASTNERVGSVECRNLATDDPHRAWREMKALCDAADDLKKRSGIKATGRKLTKPVYAFSLNWHEADNPDPEHMRETAADALRALGMEDLQAVIVEHTDTPHKHVHVIVNLVDPDTGRTRSVSNDEHKLDRWADDYEQSRGVIRSPARREKFHALDNGIKAPKRPSQAQTREEWKATRALQTEYAKRRAAEIKAAFAERVADLKARQQAGYHGRTVEAESLWKRYQADRKSIRDRYQPFIDAIWKSKRKHPPHPHTEQAFRDIQESAEWRELGRNLFRQRRRFDARERSLLGALGNAIRLHHAARKERGALANLFKLMVSPNQRKQQFQKQQDSQKQALRRRQAETRKQRAETLKASRQVELANLSMEFQRHRKAMTQRHAAEIANQKAAWRQLSEEREKAWREFHLEFVRPNREAAKPENQKELHEKFGDAAKGTDRSAKSPRTIEDVLAERTNRKGWRARRSAAERKADGSYRERDRVEDDRGRSRKRDGYERD